VSDDPGALYRLDDLRRFAVALGIGAGIPAGDASTLASQLLWYDACGVPRSGIGSLPAWLDQVTSKRINATARGRVVSERAALANLDGQNGLGPLILARAAEIAIEKARDAAFGLVRIGNLSSSPPITATAVVADSATGPFACFALGPGGSRTLALPGEGGLPVVVDPLLSEATPVPEEDGSPKRKRASTRRQAAPSTATGMTKLSQEANHSAIEAFFPWVEALAPDGGWLLGAIAVSALEPLTTFHERVTAISKAVSRFDNHGLTDSGMECRRRAREHGVAIEPAAWKSLKAKAQLLGVEFPHPSG
jgi:hypothetical protein